MLPLRGGRQATGVGQSYQKFECILIDDGSSDSSYSICKEYEEKDTRMRCFTQKNHGVSYTRNKGISLEKFFRR